MRNRHSVLLAAFAIGLMSAVAFAQEFQRPDVPLKGRIGLGFWSQDSAMRQELVDGTDIRYEDRGQGTILEGNLEFGKVGIQAYYIIGKMDTLPGGSDFGTPTYNPMSGEKQETSNVSMSYQVFDSPYTGRVNLSLGYCRFWAQPAITASNWNAGLEYGVFGRRDWDSGLSVYYRLAYMPSSTIYSNSDGILPLDDALTYKLTAEYPVYKGIALYAGYQGYKLKGTITFDNSYARVHLQGWSGGLVYKF